MILKIREELVFVLLGGVCCMIFFCFVGIFKLLFLVIFVLLLFEGRMPFWT